MTETIQQASSSSSAVRGVGPAAALIRRSGGVAAWSVRHPVGVCMLALAVVVLGLFSLSRLGVDLLPHIIYPEVRVRVLERGVPAAVMEDRITRQLEEQLAITEDAVSVQSSSQEGRSVVNLTFEYGKDIDVALRDASSRLDRAKRFLPDTIDPPIIFKLDPSQIPAAEFIVYSALREPAEIGEWADYRFARWFLNLPGIAAVEVGGAPDREVSVLPDQHKLAGYGFDIDDIVSALQRGNQDTAGGALRMAQSEINSRTSGRFRALEEIANLPLRSGSDQAGGSLVRIKDVAEVVDGYADERLRIRLNQNPGIKVSFQKQPQANTVAVIDAVNRQLEWLEREGLIPRDIEIARVADQSIFVRQALANAGTAAVSGAILAMLVVFFFLGDLRRTLIIGIGIPVAVMVALILMASLDLTVNVMTLGGLALGIGLLVDNTIVMLENTCRHQAMGKPGASAAIDAAREVNSAILASTSTNLVAVLPFLFIGGLIGLIFNELIATISAAIVASMLLALTVVPALASRVPYGRPGLFRRLVDFVTGLAQRLYAMIVSLLLRGAWLVPIPFILAMVYVWPALTSGKDVFLPNLDSGRVSIYLTADAGISLDQMDGIVDRVERYLLEQPDVVTAYSQIGGFVFGRSQYERSNRSRIDVQLVAHHLRNETNEEWSARMRKELRELKLVGVKVRMRVRGIRGIRMGRSDEPLSIRVQGNDLDELARIGARIVDELRSIDGIRNLGHSLEDTAQELSVVVDRERAAMLGLDVDEIGRAVQVALRGIVVTDFIDEDRQIDVRLRLPTREMQSLESVESVVIFPASENRRPVRLRDIASVELIASPTIIKRDRQQRIVEIRGSVADAATLGQVLTRAEQAMANFDLPTGYTLYDGGALKDLQRGRSVTQVLVALAIFLVLVVMAVQYESLRNPLIIISSVPFAAIGVAMAIQAHELALSMPLWLGVVMLCGIVVNNAIVLVEYVEIARDQGMSKREAVIEAGRQRLRPILMTSLTTVVGMLPLALGLGAGSELLQPLALVIVWGLSFSTVVSLLLVPALYLLFGRRDTHRAPQYA